MGASAESCGGVAAGVVCVPLETAQANWAARVSCVVLTKTRFSGNSLSKRDAVPQPGQASCCGVCEPKVHPPRGLTGAFDVGHDAPKGGQPLAHSRGSHHCLNIWQLRPLHQVGQYVPHDLQPDTVRRQSGSCRDSTSKHVTQPGKGFPPGLRHKPAGTKILPLSRHNTVQDQWA